MDNNTVGKLFNCENRVFEIPSYQRAYSWGKKQIYQFIEDLQTADSQYYLGHFLFEKKENDDHVLVIIDGQQRLTTCVIFFSCVRKELQQRKNNGETVSLNLDNITDYYLRDIHKDTRKFYTVNYDDNFFVNEIIDAKDNYTQEPQTKSQKRIREAKERFEQQLHNTPTTEIEKWCRLIENATITEYVVGSKTQAAQLFAFQNDRGKSLSNLEKIKAYFMLQIYLCSPNPERTKENINFLEDEFSLIYKQIVRITRKEREDEVLNYYWHAVSGKGFDKKEVYESIKNKLKSESEKNDWIREFTSGLLQAFQTVEEFEKNEYRFAKDLRYLDHLALAYPFIIKAKKLGASEKAMNRLIWLLENITFRCLLRGGRADIDSRLDDYLARYNSAEEVDKNINDMIHDIKHNDRWWYWNNYNLKEYLKSSNFYQNRVVNYVLWKYELYLCNDNHLKPHNITFDELIRNESIEHIAPQTQTKGDSVANGYGIYNDKEEPKNGIVSGKWLNRVGNLMLISQSQNSSIGNKPFDKKLKTYGEANLLNQQKEIVSFVSDKNNPVWDKVAIERRHKKILDAAMEIWDLKGI